MNKSVADRHQHSLINPETATPQTREAAIPQHCNIVIPQDRNTAILQTCITETPQHYDIATPQDRNNANPRNCNTATLQHRNTANQTCVTATKQHCENATPLDRNTATLSTHGTAVARNHEFTQLNKIDHSNMLIGTDSHTVGRRYRSVYDHVTDNPYPIDSLMREVQPSPTPVPGLLPRTLNSIPDFRPYKAKSKDDPGSSMASTVLHHTIGDGHARQAESRHSYTK